MKIFSRKGERGNEIRFMLPETEDDAIEVRADAESGDFDDRESFADDPGSWDVPDEE